MKMPCDFSFILAARNNLLYFLPVMWSLRRVVSKSANITPTAIAQNVVDLVLGEADRVVGVNAELGSLKSKVGQVTGVPVEFSKGTFRMEKHTCNSPTLSC